MLIVYILISTYFAYLAYRYTEQINRLTRKHCNGIRAAYTFKRVGAVAAVIAILTFDPFAIGMSLLLPLGMVILSSRKVQDHYKWMRSEGLGHTIVHD